MVLFLSSGPATTTHRIVQTFKKIIIGALKKKKVEPTAAALGSSSGLEAGPPSKFELARDFEAAYRAGLKAALIPQGLEVGALKKKK